MSAKGRWSAIAIFVAAAAIVAALSHLVVVLLVPYVAAHDAFARVAALGPVNATFALPRAAPGEHSFPYADPAVAGAVCRYDLSAGPLHVEAPIGRAGFASLAFHSRLGLVYYALTDKAATHGMMEAVLATPAQARALAAREDEDNPSPTLRILAPAPEGFVVMRAFSELPSLYPAAEAQVRRLACRSEPPP